MPDSGDQYCGRLRSSGSLAMFAAIRHERLVNFGHTDTIATVPLVGDREFLGGRTRGEFI